MALRRRTEGNLVVESTRDLALVRAMLSEAGMTTDGVEWPAAGYLVAWFGDDAVGLAGVEPKLDAALIRSLWVRESMRRRGVGAALLTAARKAAHARGVRHLYVLGNETADGLERLGFRQIATNELVAALSGTPMVEYYRARPDDLALQTAWYVDIYDDGVIRR